MFYDYDNEKVINAIKNNKSIASTMKSLGITNYRERHHYSKFNEFVKENNIDISHFPKKIQKRPIDDYFSNKFPLQSNKLRKRLISEGYFEHKCSKCNLSEWMGELIPIELDHIDGNNKNNSLDNLRLLCPNCHAQTDTYKGKNIKKPKEKYNSKSLKNKKVINKQLPKERKKKCTLSNAEIYKIFLDNNSNYTKTSKIIGISDNAIRKRIKSFL